MAGTAAGAAFAGIAAAAPAAAEPRLEPPGARIVDLGYAIHVGGIYTADAAIRLALDRDRYRVDVSAEVTGVIRQVLPWSMRAVAAGRMAGPRKVPVHAEIESHWRGKRRWTVLQYAGGTPHALSSRPIPGAAAAPAGLTRGTLDIVSAIVSAARAAGEPGSCAVRLPVFDGRRRLDAVFEAHGEDELPPSRRSAYSGRAAVCDLTVEILHGRRRESDYGGLASGEKTMTFWFARLFDGFHPLPVRVQYETDFGLAIMHLTAARAAGAGPSKVYRLPS